jgi:hypothetical protein
MCGPIALATPYAQAGVSNKWKYVAAYNSGRIFTYMVIGMLFGLFGKGLSIAGFQQWVSILAGVLILLFLFFPKLLYSNAFNFGIIFKIKQLKQLFTRNLVKKTPLSAAILGMLNGILPCGMVYVAVTGAIAAANAYEGALYMGFFGIGTSISMSAVFYSAEFINETVRSKLKKVIPVFIFFIGMIFILRGLNLGIPYISPKIVNNTEMQCCHK